MKTLLKNLTILTMLNDSFFLGDIGIEDKKIAFVGSNPSFKADIIYDMSGKVALPGLVNGHTHLAMTLLRNYKDTQPTLQAWLNEIFPIENKLTDKEIYIGSLAGLAELIKSGCTTYTDMYFNADQTIKASLEAGVRSVQGLTFFGDGTEAKRRIRENYPKMKKAIGSSDLVRTDAAVHSIYTCTKECYQIAQQWAKDNNSMVNTHLSETFKEVEDSIKDFSLTPVKYLESLHFFDAPSYLAHGVFIQDEEIAILKEHNVSIIHNPSSNCKLASGIAPIAKYKLNGLNIALGTDGASSNNNLSLLKEMNLANLISTVTTKNPMALTPYEILKMATINGAKALGLEDRIGSLEEGKEADITILDLDRVNTTPVNNPFSAIVFSADTSNVDTVFCQGRCLLKNGKLQTLDEKVIVKNLKTAVDKVINL